MLGCACHMFLLMLLLLLLLLLFSAGCWPQPAPLAWCAPSKPPNRSSTPFSGTHCVVCKSCVLGRFLHAAPLCPGVYNNILGPVGACPLQPPDSRDCLCYRRIESAGVGEGWGGGERQWCPVPSFSDIWGGKVLRSRVSGFDTCLHQYSGP